MPQYILAIDQGTTSSRSIICSSHGEMIAMDQHPVTPSCPENGWVEQDPEAIWQSVLSSLKGVLAQATLSAAQIHAIGITNQRETTLVWNRDTGSPVYPAIVWQDRRTADTCNAIADDPAAADYIRATTGLLPDPYFSATKVAWILDNVPGARAQAEAGELLFGTVDSFLIWRLSGGTSHVTDATNASRTLLFDIHKQCWDQKLLDLFNIPPAMLPTVLDCADQFAELDVSLLGAAIPVTGVAGDQQAALIGQACFEPGMTKSTFGTGGFMMLNTGTTPVSSQHRLLTTVGYRLNGEVTYALEGSIFMAGATMQWLRDGLKLLDNVADSAQLALDAPADSSVYLIPAFTGLGAPYWDPQARGAILGLTRDTGIKEIIAAGLLSVCYQTRDLQCALQSDGVSPLCLRVDGGMASNDYLMKSLADILGVTVTRPEVTETTALGAAFLAGLQTGAFTSMNTLTQLWQCGQTFEPTMPPSRRDHLYAGWKSAVERIRCC
ncbi:glycerol kinase GlpK [Alteromonas halophila]|uniref:glycerol kinase n=1 Tax=Alteromonas halophila TaxID=516698 RepID=A0A918JJ32_9ALTE|nr:glycerol kinase GlpK [Alteromonas halophila]GGW81086.1 glycerol kinase 1 [Alteromonas halophila]